MVLSVCSGMMTFTTHTEELYLGARAQVDELHLLAPRQVEAAGLQVESSLTCMQLLGWVFASCTM